MRTSSERSSTRFSWGTALPDGPRRRVAVGADRAYAVEDPKLGKYTGDLFAAAIVQVIEKLGPRIVLFGNSDIGADLGPRAAFKLKRVIATDCVSLEMELETKTLLQTKPVYGGLAMTVLASDGFPQMATVRPKSITPADRNQSGTTPAMRIDVDLSAAPDRIRVVSRGVEKAKGVKLEDAEIIVSGGRGMGGPEGFERVGRCREVSQRRRWRVAGRGGQRLDTDVAPGRSYRDDSGAKGLRRRGNLRRQPAHDRLREVAKDYRDQQGPWQRLFSSRPTSAS